MDSDTDILDVAADAAARTGRAVDAARRALASKGVYLMPSDDVLACVGADATSWTRFAAHWADLAVDEYAAGHGIRRLRRYGHFLLAPATGVLKLLPHEVFVQPDDTNPPHTMVERHFEPLTGAFIADPALRSLLALLGRTAGALGSPQWWSVKVHPLRVIATEDDKSEPTPEGRHRDGVTLVSSLLIGRGNATGGESTVYSSEGDKVLSGTLHEPGSLLLSDDRTTLHGVSPIRPVDAGLPAYWDVLVTTLTPD
ncbi:2OG-Fe dioxygenase family protein [Streptomyces sp. NPDC006283]|uniref:2OG-Fe dioxygenase family protein n=1 Tax=Streptomyces sp. NPDC006283 TaxID=3156741 RepID=UPI0033A0940C